MNSLGQRPVVSTTLATFTGLIVFILALTLTFFAIYTFLQTGQSILGEITFTPAGWPYP
ncbi:MAG TPA: hypothetical protein VEC96_13145 [Anaerolineae bacterium]|nr:hypothetical protein [Anaerolineae bacterium]HXW01117.1 hypothetical protein [Anaerolineae bacterium]